MPCEGIYYQATGLILKLYFVVATLLYCKKQ